MKASAFHGRLSMTRPQQDRIVNIVTSSVRAINVHASVWCANPEYEDEQRFNSLGMR